MDETKDPLAGLEDWENSLRGRIDTFQIGMKAAWSEQPCTQHSNISPTYLPTTWFLGSEEPSNSTGPSLRESIDTTNGTRWTCKAPSQALEKWFRSGISSLKVSWLVLVQPSRRTQTDPTTHRHAGHISTDRWDPPWTASATKKLGVRLVTPCRRLREPTGLIWHHITR